MVAEPPETALVSLVDSPYGFSLADMGISVEDLQLFYALDIRETGQCQQVGKFTEFQGRVEHFFRNMGDNDLLLVQRAAARIQQIAERVFSASGRETAWLYLSATAPSSNEEDALARWHIDGEYYRPHPPESIQYKFVLSLVGPSTWFYPLSREFKAMRKVIWMHMCSPQFTNEFCEPRAIVKLKEGEGAFLIAGNDKDGALHAEPLFTGKRLFFSLVPCSHEEMSELRKKLVRNYNLTD